METVPRCFLLAILCLGFALSTSLACSIDATHEYSAETTYWEEEIPDPKSDESDSSNPTASRRRLLWPGRMDESTLQQKALADSLTKPTTQTPHSMRTNEWQLEMQMSRKERNRLGIRNKTLLFDFAETGHFVRVLKSDNSTLAIGTWKLHPSGIMWTFPIVCSDSTVVTLQCHADLILNPFGSRPRMVRGTVVKDCRKWFRPVVATFAGEGIGRDTVDVSYRERGFGL